jgi:hypothetical protein
MQSWARPHAKNHLVEHSQLESSNESLGIFHVRYICTCATKTAMVNFSAKLQIQTTLIAMNVSILVEIATETATINYLWSNHLQNAH